jgi:two-component system, NarL family, sensor histidine kinase DegS
MVLPPPQTKEFNDRILALEEDCQRELEQSVQSLHEIALLLQKTNQEVERLAGKELQLANRVRDMEMHLDNYGREDIRDLYSSSHEIQLRLFMMRSQAEQLQNRQQHIKEYQEKLRLLVDLLQVQQMQEGGTASLSPRPTSMLNAGGTSVFDGTRMIGHTSIMGIIEAQEDERLRISRQIHDGPTQTLTNLILRAEICERLIDRDIAEARAELNSLKAMINNSLQDTRRMIFELRPMILDDLGLVPTLRRYLVELGRLKQLQAEVTGPEHELGLSNLMQTALFRFTQSILSAMLAEGTAEHLDIRVERDGAIARIVIDATALQGDRTGIEERLEEDPHLGQRLTMLNANLTTEQRSNRGFLVEVVVPIPEEAVA